MDLSTIKYVISELSWAIFFASNPIYIQCLIGIDKFVKFMLENPLLIRLNSDKVVLICQILGWAPKA